ncbi:MAG: thiamine-phosphate kinase [Arhodomonas sp.]|nr:thiamine-phosphate kinase [Arhodomonas sp.]
MSLSEFQLIERFFAGLGAARADVRLGHGDDAALVDCGGATLALAVDTLIEGVHFPADAPAASIGHKLLAVNLSDLAAMGAEPAWALLALTLPTVDEARLAAIREGLDALASRHGLALIGGDTTRGESLVASLFVAGHAGEDALRRDGAQPGDWVWVSGAPGEAAAGLALWQGGARDGPGVAQLLRRLHWPEPRVALGRGLRGVASAAVDVSDGVVADAGHLAHRSGVALTIRAADLPLSPALTACAGERAMEYALAGGDDYELLFTAPEAATEAVRRAADAAGVTVRPVGVVAAGRAEVTVIDADGAPMKVVRGGYRHFDGEGGGR